jgi:LysM repeat protein
LVSRTTHRLIENNNNNPFSRIFSRESVKNPVYYKVAIGATSIAILFAPLFALANPFSLASIIAGFGKPANASSIDIPNSQRMDVLHPANNPDPNPTKGSSDLAIEGGEALAANVGPSGTIADVEEMPTTSQISVYTVHAGDTLSEIASMFGVTVNTIIWANDIKGGTIHEGDQLVILPVTGIRHTVLAGETLASLAKKYGGSEDEIASYNGINPSADLAVGSTIILPNAELPALKPTAPSTKIAKSTPSTTKGKTTTRKKSGSEPYLGGSGPAIGGFAWPVIGGHITQGLHGWNGVDIGGPKGSGILASAGGTVIVAKSNGGYNGGYGNYIVISHPNGTQTLYGHLSQVMVSPGETVSQGQEIGLMGSTGHSTGNHLHFEVRGAQNPFAN